MIPFNRQSPEWKAPETLLPGVMKAVRTQSLSAVPAGFFAWTTAGRMAFLLAACGAVAATFFMPFTAMENYVRVISSGMLLIAGQWYAAHMVLQQAAFTAVSAIIRNPFVGAVCLGVCAIMMATWVVNIQCMYRLLTVQKRSQLV